MSDLSNNTITVLHFHELDHCFCDKSINSFLTSLNTPKIAIDCLNVDVTINILYKLNKIKIICQNQNIECQFINIPNKITKLLGGIDKKTMSNKQVLQSESFITRIGLQTISAFCSMISIFKFLCLIIYNLLKFITLKSKAKISDCCEFLYQNSVEAFPIVALISFLVGLILSFVSVLQLERFGAGIYVADLIAIAMTREMGCIMLGIIMSGRTGAAFAASLGSMQANEELDAFKTFGIDQIDFLITPRVLSLAIMMPVLCVFADIIGILGGMVSAIPFAKSGLMQYLLQTKNALSVADIVIGLIKSIVFGVIIGTIGCYKGITCGRNASSVGKATTSTVVQSITYIIVADAIFAVIISFLGI